TSARLAWRRTWSCSSTTSTSSSAELGEGGWVTLRAYGRRRGSTSGRAGRGASLAGRELFHAVGAEGEVVEHLHRGLAGAGGDAVAVAQAARGVLALEHRLTGRRTIEVGVEGVGAIDLIVRRGALEVEAVEDAG